jgi:heptaprenyl diphosphate synthase
MSLFWDDFSGMPEDLEKVSGIIQNSIVSRNAIIKKGLENLFGGGGKLLRPALLLIAGRFGKLQEKHYKLAAALEMLHAATLIHDDVIDDSPLRRGLPSLHSQYGKRDAVLMGDFLLSRCFLLAAEHTSAQNAVHLAQVISIICTMEIEQNNDRFKSNVSLRNYRRKITGKSAVLFSLACFVGASEAKAPKAVCDRFRRIGYNIGIAFQIIDDILDYSGSPERMRKPLGTDIADGLVTMPLICAFRLGTSNVLRTIFSREMFTHEETAAIFAQVQSSGGIEEAEKYAKSYSDRALKEIACLPPGENRDMLETLTKRMLVRKE